MKISFIIQFVLLLLLIGLSNLIDLHDPDKQQTEARVSIDTVEGTNVGFGGDTKVFPTSPDPTEPVQGGTLVLAISGEPERLNPITSTSSSARRINEYIYQTLLDYENRSLYIRIYEYHLLKYRWLTCHKLTPEIYLITLISSFLSTYTYYNW